MFVKVIVCLLFLIYISQFFFDIVNKVSGKTDEI